MTITKFKDIKKQRGGGGTAKIEGIKVDKIGKFAVDKIAYSKIYFILKLFDKK